MKQGARPQNRTPLTWSGNLAYAIGLIASDGYLSKDRRHIDFTSKDKDLVETYLRCLGISCPIGKKSSGGGRSAYRAQFSDVRFYAFLESIGLMNAKSKCLCNLSLPAEHFIDFVRGYFDGDGSSSSFFDSKYKRSFRFYLSFASASPIFLDWLRKGIEDSVGVKGHIASVESARCLQLRYAKRESVILAHAIYYREDLPCLQRKYLKIQETLGIIEGRPGGEIGKHATFRS